MFTNISHSNYVVSYPQESEGSKKRPAEDEAEYREAKRQKTDINPSASANQPAVLPFGEGRFLYFDVFAAHVFPHLPVKTVHSLILTTRAYSALLRIQEILNRLCLSPKVNCFRLAFAAGDAMRQVTQARLKNEKNEEQNICQFLQQCPALTSFDLSNFEKVTNTVIKTLTQKCSQIKRLHLGRYSDVQEKTVVKLIKAFPIESLALRGFKVKTSLIFDALAQKCNHITDLNLMSLRIEDTHLTTLVKGCINLKNLALESCSQLKFPLSTILQNCTHLTSLDLYFLYNAQDVEVQRSTVVCTKLTQFKLDHCFRITNAALISLISGNTDIVSLALYACTDVKANTAAAIADNLKKLTNLDLSRCDNITNEDLSVLTQNCSRLVSLSLNDLQNFTDEGVKKNFSSLPHLKHLRLNDNYYLTKQGILNIAQNCSHLQTLQLRRQASSLKPFFPNHPTLPNANVNGITDSALESLAQNNPNLTELDLNCQSLYAVTGAVCEAFAQHCTKIKKLTLSQGIMISDKEISALARRCTNLTSLNLWNFPYINGSFIKDLAHCPNLKNLVLENCENLIHISGLDLLIKHCPTLKNGYIQSWGQEIPVSMRAVENSLVRGSQRILYHSDNHNVRVIPMVDRADPPSNH